jgi:hypothetical protein
MSMCCIGQEYIAGSMQAISETSMMKVSVFSNIDSQPFAKLEQDVIPNRYQKKRGGGWAGDIP